MRRAITWLVWSVLWLCALSQLAFAGPSPTPGTFDLMPHRARYSLVLSKSDPGSPVLNAFGSYEIAWSRQCDGWSYEQKMDLTFARADGMEDRWQATHAAFESLDGLRYRFHTLRRLNDYPQETFAGQAVLDSQSGGGHVDFVQPQQLTLTLPADTLFPRTHLAQLLKAMADHRQLLELQVFEGDFERLITTINAFIGRTFEAPLNVPEPAKGLTWLVRLAYFTDNSPLINGTGNGLGNGMANRAPGNKTNGTFDPLYEMEFSYNAGGVSHDMLIDFGEFVLSSNSADITALPQPQCP
ncbi:MAG: DUF1849 family protein [Alphaproteobacteria bacterium]|nr:DUF1849 family protein [Alphaproteobacteria bacterium]